MDRNPIDIDLKKKLLVLANVRLTEIRLYREAIRILLDEFNGNPSIEEAIDFLIDKARKDYHMLSISKLWIK